MEAIAKLIYEHWFVQFDFPNEEGKPYKSSGGEMVYDKTLKRDIPKGWKVKSLSELISLTRGVIYSSTDEESSDGIDVVEIYRGNNICNGHIIEDENRVFIPRKKVSPAQYLDDFSIFITMSSGSKAHVGKVAISYNSKEKSYGGFCSKIVPDKEYRNIVFGFFASDLYRTWIESICSGTGINNLRDDHFDLIKLSIPINSEFLKKYAFYTNSLFKKIQNIVKETDSLCKLRDFLLPMLMNGQVEIAD